MERLTKLANQILTYSIKVKENENLLIELFGTDGIPLAKELISQAHNLKINVFFNIIEYEVLEEFLKNATKEEIKRYALYDLNRMKEMDAYIGISAKRKENEFENVPMAKMELYNTEYMLPVHFKERVKKKWCILRYPNDFFAEMNKMSLEQAEDFYFNVCNLDYGKMSNSMNKLVELMNKTDKVRIIGINTDLIFSIKGIKAEKYIGNYNLPDGEVATAPVKNSLNGYITYNTQTKYNGKTFNNIRFEFKNGKIINATANDTEALNEILNADEGARYIGEFAIGLNPYITRVNSDVLFDEKVCGSFHLTPGNALQESDNGNRSSIHWDIVNIQTPEYGGGEIWFDDVLIMKDGRFILKELECLNPEEIK